MGPFGTTVLLSNSSRDLQQVLLAGGPDSATTLVANLELCARRNGSRLPAVGQLTLDHLLPLQRFVSQNSPVDKNDTWIYYAVINIPGSTLDAINSNHQHDEHEQHDHDEPLGPHAKGFLMYRRLKEQQQISLSSFGGGNGHHKQLEPWKPGYFLLKYVLCSIISL